MWCEREKLTTLYSVPQSRGASVGAYHRGRGYPRGLCKEVPVFSRLRETCRLKILQVNAESSLETTLTSHLGGKSRSPRLESAPRARKQLFDGPISGFRRVQTEYECSICIVRVGREILCKVGGFFFCFEMKGLALRRDGIGLDRYRANPRSRKRDPGRPMFAWVRSVGCVTDLRY